MSKRTRSRTIKTARRPARRVKAPQIRLTPKIKDAIRQVFRGLRAMIYAPGDDGIYVKYAVENLLANDWWGTMPPVFASSLPTIAKRARLIRQRQLDNYAEHDAKRAAKEAKQAELDAMAPEERAAHDADVAKREAAREAAIDAMVKLGRSVDSNPAAVAECAEFIVSKLACTDAGAQS
jgi:hypothetical protein